MPRRPIKTIKGKSAAKMQAKLYNSIFNNYSFYNLQKAVNKVCPRGFTTDKCQKIFTQLVINIFYTLSMGLSDTPNRYKIIEYFISIIPITQITMLPIKEKQVGDIALFCDLMQDHAFGTFINAYLATVLKDLIMDHR